MSQHADAICQHGEINNQPRRELIRMIQVLEAKPRNPSKPLTQASATNTKQAACLLAIESANDLRYIPIKFGQDYLHWTVNMVLLLVGSSPYTW